MGSTAKNTRLGCAAVPANLAIGKCLEDGLSTSGVSVCPGQGFLEKFGFQAYASCDCAANSSGSGTCFRI